MTERAVDLGKPPSTSKDATTPPAYENTGTIEPTSEWGTERLDLDAYLGRIGYRGHLSPSAETLRRLHRAHAATIPFENLSVILGHGVELDIESLQEKLARRRRGGYCYEHNLLFAAVLERLGFGVTRLLARVRLGSDTPRPRSHATLLVDLEGTRWLADVGFGGEGLLEPIPFANTATLQVGTWAWRLDRDGGDWVLRSRRPDGWFDLYAFALERHHFVDFVTANYFTANHPSSPFVNNIIAQRTKPYTRHTLRSGELTTERATGVTRRHLGGNELAAVLRDTFGIILAPDDARALQSLPDEAASAGQIDPRR